MLAADAAVDDDDVVDVVADVGTADDNVAADDLFI